ncbi:MAG: hypothetical protein WCO00_02845 [Rhodospirillaceae bacterium]
MYKRFFIATLALWLVTVVAAATLFVRGSTAPGSDGRTAVVLAAAERDFILGEMRGMLGAVQEITGALASGDRTGVARAATAVGMTVDHGVPVALMAKLPLEFKQQGMAMHAGFDEIAAAARRGDAVPALTGRLADQLSLCLGCHQSFRFSPSP